MTRNPWVLAEADQQAAHYKEVLDESIADARERLASQDPAWAWVAIAANWHRALLGGVRDLERVAKEAAGTFAAALIRLAEQQPQASKRPDARGGEPMTEQRYAGIDHLAQELKATFDRDQLDNMLDALSPISDTGDDIGLLYDAVHLAATGHMPA